MLYFMRSNAFQRNKYIRINRMEWNASVFRCVPMRSNAFQGPIVDTGLLAPMPPLLRPGPRHRPARAAIRRPGRATVAAARLRLSLGTERGARDPQQVRLGDCVSAGEGDGAKHWTTREERRLGGRIRESTAKGSMARGLQ